jgi:hypothetical protein
MDTASASSSVVVLCSMLLHISTVLGIVELPYPVGQKLFSQRRTVTT